MIALDTNILARLILRDDEAQFQKARALLGLEEIKPREPSALTDALQWYEAGLDFPDALRLALSRADEALMTFDDRFVRRADREGAAPPVVLA